MFLVPATDESVGVCVRVRSLALCARAVLHVSMCSVCVPLCVRLLRKHAQPRMELWQPCLRLSTGFANSLTNMGLDERVVYKLQYSGGMNHENDLRTVILRSHREERSVICLSSLPRES